LTGLDSEGSISITPVRGLVFEQLCVCLPCPERAWSGGQAGGRGGNMPQPRWHFLCQQHPEV